MKLIFLNAWNGKQEIAIRKFLAVHASSTDVFCFQESSKTMRVIASEYLHNFSEKHAYAYAFKDKKGIVDFSQSTYIRKKYKVLQNQVLVNKHNVRGLGIDSLIEYRGKPIHILNYHGIYSPIDKLDSSDRLKQSRDIIKYYENKPEAKILGGDFNFLPETKSYNLFEAHNYRELVKEYKVTTTRNHFYLSQPSNKHLFSDYIFVSSMVKVDDFTVLKNEISDHLPLILNVSLV